MQKLTRHKIRGFIKNYATAAPVLDIGAGSTQYADIFPNRTTLDIDSSRRPDIVGDAEDLPFQDASFGVVICSEVFEHLKHPERAAAEIHRVLKPGGTLVLTTRFAFPVHDSPGDYWRFTPYGLSLLFDGWDILALEAETDAFETIAVLLQRIIFQTSLRGGKVTKLAVWSVAKIFSRLDWLITNRYGDIHKSATVPTLLSSGVFIACRKPDHA